YYAALEKGFYSDAGLDVRFQEGGSGKSCYAIMMSGYANYCADDGDLIFHFVTGSPIVALAAIFQNSPVTLLTLKGSGLKTPADLVGKRVETLHGGIPIPEIAAMFEREGIELDKLENKEDSFGVGKLIDGKVDAIFGYVSNEPEALKSAGLAYNMIRPRSYGVDFYGDSLFTPKHEVEEHAERTKAFREASLKGWRYAMAHKEEIVDLIRQKYNGRLSRDHLSQEAGAIERLMQISLVEVGPVAVLCRSFNRILCAKGERLWERNVQQNLDKKRSELR
ncbi:MAG: ABC transporter substrate-binding protein, partial [Alphaproteobacteria bacterium]|nr:ABC transporter substrate-binding protein [Alphaproteobacteria bacterium]